MDSDLLSVLGVGRPCAGCRGPGGPWCPPCAATVAGPAASADLRPWPEGLPVVLAASLYAGPLREALVAFKDHGRWSLRPVLGSLLGAAAAAVLAESEDPTTVTLVPVVGSPGSVRRRDGDHVRELALVAARTLRRLGVDARVAPALVPLRRRADQVGLGRTARAANLQGSMRAHRRAVGDGPVVVVDDLVTTGATLAEAVRALGAVGCPPIGAAVVASTRRSAPRIRPSLTGSPEC